MLTIPQPTEKQTMTTATIRRNADGQQNLTDLRKALDKTKHKVYRQGSNWIILEWSDHHRAYLESPAPYWWSERQAIQSLLGEVESKDEAKYHAQRLARKQLVS